MLKFSLHNFTTLKIFVYSFEKSLYKQDQIAKCQMRFISFSLMPVTYKETNCILDYL